MSGKKTPTRPVRKPPGGGAGRGSINSSPPSTKKSNIFDFFRDAQLRASDAPEHCSFSAGEPFDENSEGSIGARRTGAGDYGRSGSGSRNGGRNGRSIELHPADEASPRSADDRSAPKISGPAWGKLVDPSKQRRWWLLQRLREERMPPAEVDSITWARRSYTLSYAPVFQDARPPGVGSTAGTWWWNSQSHVFGGAQACDSAVSVDHAKQGSTNSPESEEVNTDTAQKNSRGLKGPESDMAGNDEDSAPGSRKAVEKRRRRLQRHNFSVMCAWLSASLVPCVCKRSDSALDHDQTAGSPDPPSKTFLDVAVERHDGGPAAAFAALESLASKPREKGDVEAELDPVALALSLYHRGKVWRRIERRPPLPRRSPGPFYFRHPDDGDLGAAIDASNSIELRRRTTGDYSAGLALLSAGLAVSLSDVSRKRTTERGRTFLGQRNGGNAVGDEASDPLALLAPREILTASETRELTKALGIAPKVLREPGGGKRGNGASNAPADRYRKSDNRRGRSRSGGGGTGGGVEGKEEVNRSLEDWIDRPVDVARKRARASRMVHEATGILLCTGSGEGQKRRGRKRSYEEDVDTTSGGNPIIIRLTDDAREAIHRVYVAFFAAARHGPLDVHCGALLSKDLSRVRFAGEDAHKYSTTCVNNSPGRCHYNGGSDGGGKREPPFVIHPKDFSQGGGIETVGEAQTELLLSRKAASFPRGVELGSKYTTLESGVIQPESWPRQRASGEKMMVGPTYPCPPPPQVLSSVEAFSEYYRVVSLADMMDFAAEAGDSELAFRALHKASTVLLPSSCPLCRRLCRRNEEGHEKNAMGAGAAAATTAEEEAKPHCDICQLSASVVMRGVGLLEREKEYDNAIHYLDILLRAPSLRMSVHRPRYWLRLVTDLSHRKRSMEALKACDQALMEADPAPVSTSSSDARVDLFPGTKRDCLRAGSECVSKEAGSAAASKEATEVAVAVMPLGESLPLRRKAIRLAVPPLRWRKRPLPQLREARLRVMTLDLSWRRARTGQDGSSVESLDARPVGPVSHRHAGPVPAHRDAEGTKNGRNAFEGKDEAREGARKSATREPFSSTIVTPGTSLEQAVLDVMLAELGPEWTGLHAENSICLGLFALLCWDAIFAPVVATRAASPLPPAYPQRNSFRATGGNLTGSPVSGDRHPHARSDREDSPSVGMSSGNRLADGSVVEPGDCSERVAERSGHHSLGVGIGEDCPSGRSTAEEADQGRNARNDEEDVFYYHPFPSPYQSEPLDLMTTAFAWRRRHLLRGIYDRVEQQGGAESLLRCNWGKHYGKACTGLNWNLFPDGVEGWATVAAAIGPTLLSRVCRNLASNYWVWRHGLPDLFLWRKNVASCPIFSPTSKPDRVAPGQTKAVASGCLGPSSSSVFDSSNGGGSGDCDHRETKRMFAVPGSEVKCKWVEVKGPGDSLSGAQDAWLDTLIGAGADAVVLRVEDSA